jgi:8-amino-7-oxononanoate synthase
MQQLEQKLLKRLESREENESLRELGHNQNLIDFSSNDYLGFSKNQNIYSKTLELLKKHKLEQNGSGGSRLISGNNNLYDIAEQEIAKGHNVESALIFNSGYNANVGLISAVCLKGDVILFDEFCHASIREGIQLSHAKAYKFKHHNLTDLELKLKKFSNNTIYIITESVFSMDGDSPDLDTLISLSKTYNAKLIIDEAHAVGVFGEHGCGLINTHNANSVFARVVTFGKALGCHGAAILGSNLLKTYLINFSKPFIYTTALAPHAVATISCAYKELLSSNAQITLQQNIIFFNEELVRLQLKTDFIESDSAIQSALISGNSNVKWVSEQLQENQYDVKAILSPTVPEHHERLRFCLHSFNTKEEITQVLTLLKQTLYAKSI